MTPPTVHRRAHTVIAATVLALALTFGMSATPAAAQPITAVQAAPTAQALPLMPTVSVGWNWWIMGGYAYFDSNETRTMAQMGVAGAASYAAAKIPYPLGKAAAAALGVGLWLTAQNAIGQGRCMAIWFSVLYRSLDVVDC